MPFLLTMQITILTLFPQALANFLNQSILKKAQQKKKVRFNLLNWRQFTTDKHHTVDNRPFGGGSGMLLMIEPLVKALNQVEQKYGPAHKILLCPQGQLWNQSKAKKTIKNLQDSKHLILICGHYEGVDERLNYYIDERISIGQYILSGGESAALVLVDSLVRLLPGVLKKKEAIQKESFMQISKNKLFAITKDPQVLKQPASKITLLEYPQYTKPENFQGHKVPAVLLSGHHQKQAQWQIKKAWEKTKKSR